MSTEYQKSDRWPSSAANRSRSQLRWTERARRRMQHRFLLTEAKRARGKLHPGPGRRPALHRAGSFRARINIKRHSDIDCRPQSSCSLGKLSSIPTRFDVILFMGVFYNLRYPLMVFDQLSRLRPSVMFFQTIVRGVDKWIELEDNYPIQERRIFEDTGYPSLFFVERRYGADPTNWWIPNRSCVEALLRSSGFAAPNREVFVCAAPTRAPAEDPVA